MTRSVATTGKILVAARVALRGLCLQFPPLSAAADSGTITIVVLRDQYIVNSLKIRELSKVQELVGKTRPDFVRVYVCPDLSTQQMAVFREALKTVYMGGLAGEWMSLKALECGWNGAREKPALG